ncbi:hypothetical protein [Tsukamurella soli]|uniref:hypothetical protein n=1 Tax=Tsukamurella soli TaxID=644556 RepID=UPI0031E6ACDD
MRFGRGTCSGFGQHRRFQVVGVALGVVALGVVQLVGVALGVVSRRFVLVGVWVVVWVVVAWVGGTGVRVGIG